MQPIRPARRVDDFDLRKFCNWLGLRSDAAGVQVSHRREMIAWGNRLVDGLKFFARLEANGLARRDIYFGAGAGIASDAGLARAHVENAEAAKLDAIAATERL